MDVFGAMFCADVARKGFNRHTSMYSIHRPLRELHFPHLLELRAWKKLPFCRPFSPAYLWVIFFRLYLVRFTSSEKLLFATALVFSSLDVTLCSSTVYTSCWTLRPKCSGLILRPLDIALQYLLSVDAVLCVSSEICLLDIARQEYTREGASSLRFMDSVAGQ